MGHSVSLLQERQRITMANFPFVREAALAVTQVSRRGAQDHRAGRRRGAHGPRPQDAHHGQRRAGQPAQCHAHARPRVSVCRRGDCSRIPGSCSQAGPGLCGVNARPASPRLAGHHVLGHVEVLRREAAEEDVERQPTRLAGRARERDVCGPLQGLLVLLPRTHAVNAPTVMAFPGRETSLL